MRHLGLFDFLTETFSEAWKTSMVQGTVLILLGIGILMVPQLLVAMVAGLFIFLGVTFLSLGWQYRNFQKSYRERFRWTMEDPF